MRHRMMKHWIIILMVFASTACTQEVQLDKPAIQAEISRLSAKANLTQEDLVTLGMLVEGHHDAEHEFEDIALMVAYGEQRHAVHSLGFLNDVVMAGAHGICPGHELAHYYVYMRHGNRTAAEHPLEHAKEHYAEWKEQATAYNAEYPTVGFEELVAKIEYHLQQIDAGNATASDEDIEFLTNSLCVEAHDAD